MHLDASKDQISSILDAKDKMMDELGINQHHDAVSGTAKQHVADDYAKRLFEGMKVTNKEYGKLIQENIQQQTGMTTSSEWEQCFRTNSTYLDCPIANYAEETNYKMAVAVHNPSANPIGQASFAVPHGHYKVEKFNVKTQALEDVDASVLCSHDNLENGETIKSCFMHVNLETDLKDISTLMLTYD